MGPSGSGKSTLLYILGALDPPSSGHRHARRAGSVRARRARAGGVPQQARSASSSRITRCCRSARCSRTCWPRRSSRRPRARATRPGRGRARELLDAGRPRRSSRPPARRAVGRREAARRRRARADSRAAAAAVRRADRQPRSDVGRHRRDAAARPAQTRSSTILVVVTHSAALAERFPVRYEMNGGDARYDDPHHALDPAQRARTHWRTNLAVVLGVATAVSVLAGALVVGDSVRGSLRDIALGRLGRTDSVMSSRDSFARRWRTTRESAAAPRPPHRSIIAERVRDARVVGPPGVERARLRRRRTVLAASMACRRSTASSCRRRLRRKSAARRATCS